MSFQIADDPLETQSPPKYPLIRKNPRCRFVSSVQAANDTGKYLNCRSG
jgi:hypothetical protein